MERKKVSEFPQELLNRFDGYVHGNISPRQFLDRAGPSVLNLNHKPDGCSENATISIAA
jgi:hypothetical protein